jgi:glutaminyl-peptide cyclotransferase
MTRRGLAWLVLASTVSSLCAGATIRFDGRRAFEDLRKLVLIGPRPAGSSGAEKARRYLADELARAGLTVREQAFDAVTPLGSVRMVNLIGTLPGERSERVAIAGHYDTKLFRDFEFVGANDGASSAAFVLELGRVLKERKNPLTIELLFFDGEEAVVDWAGTDHTYGSRYYVQAAKRDGTLVGLKALILVDMIGDRHLTIRRETN